MIFNCQVATSTHRQITTLTTISIIIAIYNRKDELFELLNSLSHQTDKDFEIIIVDDGSKIDLRPTIELFKESLNIQFFRKDNSGPGLSRNYGARRAKNDWLVFVDSDVIVEKDYIENIKKNLIENPCDAFGGADKAHKCHRLSSLTRNTLCSFGRHRRLALFLNRRPRKEKVRTAENLCGLQDGADCRNRTGDLRVTSALLYQLS